jgi:hypothetical protein
MRASNITCKYRNWKYFYVSMWWLTSWQTTLLPKKKTIKKIFENRYERHSILKLFKWNAKCMLNFIYPKELLQDWFIMHCYKKIVPSFCKYIQHGNCTPSLTTKQKLYIWRYYQKDGCPHNILCVFLTMTKPNEWLYTIMGMFTFG